jgi:hypothetical protein
MITDKQNQKTIREACAKGKDAIELKDGGERGSGRLAIPRRSRTEGPLLQMLQTAPNFFQSGSCAVLVEIAPRRAGCSDRANHLVVDLGHDTATEQKQVWQLGEQRGDWTDDLGESYRQLRRASPYMDVS